MENKSVSKGTYVCYDADGKLNQDGSIVLQQTENEVVLQAKYLNYAADGEVSTLPADYIGTYTYTSRFSSTVIIISEYSITLRTSSGSFYAYIGYGAVYNTDGGYYVVFSPAERGNDHLYKLSLNTDNKTLSAQDVGDEGSANTFQKLPDYGQETTLGADYYGKEFEFVEMGLFTTTYTLTIDDEGYVLFSETLRSNTTEYELSLYADPNNQGKYFVLGDNGGNTILHYVLSFDANGNAVLSDPDSGAAVYTLAPKAAEEV